MYHCLSAKDILRGVASCVHFASSNIMSFTVLKDEEIKQLLEALTVDELEAFYTNLKEALHDYSNGIQTPGAPKTSIHQPERQHVSSPTTGATTLFMPSNSPAGVGVKGKPEEPTQAHRHYQKQRR